MVRSMHTRSHLGVLPAVILGLLAVSAYAQEDTAAAEPLGPFAYLVLNTDEGPGAADLHVSGDSVFFTYYFVDTECSTYRYKYRLEKQTLLVTRHPIDSLSCDTEGQGLYGISGSIAGVAPGRYWLILRSVCGSVPEELSKEAVVVGKPK